MFWATTSPRPLATTDFGVIPPVTTFRRDRRSRSDGAGSRAEVSDRRTAVGEAVPLEDAVPLGEAVPLMPGCCAGAASPEPVACALVMGGFGDPSVSEPALRTAGSRASPWPTAPQAPSRATAKTTTGGVARRLVGL